jgi:MinD-like ATPase involved in chromosome partitioning or flagellar assembly
MTDNPTLLVAGDQASERAALSRWPRARVMGSFRDLSLVEYVLSGMRVDIVVLDPGLPTRGETLQDWIARFRAAFPDVSLVLLDSSVPARDGTGSPAETDLEGAGSRQSGSLLVSQTVVVWSPKGGVGKTFLATNLACAAAIATGGRAGLLDLDLYSGDASVHLDLLDGPTITEMLPTLGDLRPEGLDRFTQRHGPSGLSVISSPRRPELSDLVTTEHVRAVLSLAGKRWALLYVDTPPDITSDIVGECIDAASKIVLVVTQDVATLKQSKLAVDIFGKLGIPRETVVVVLNRASRESLMPVAKVQEFLGAEILGTIPDDRKAAERSVFEGKPAVLYGKTELADAIWQVAGKITPGLECPRTRRITKRRRDFPW